MYIKMNSDKNLIITIPTTIYRGENKADLITFLVPAQYGDINLADCAMMMRYILPDGTGKSEPLSYLPEMYKDYLRFSTVANTRLTSDDGEITVWLTAFDADDGVIFKTGEVIVTVEPSKDISGYLPQEDLDEIERLTAKVTELEDGMAELDTRKADNMTYDSDGKILQLTSNGTLIGDPVDMSEMVNEDEVIDFGDQAPSDEGDSDDVIHF